MKKILSIILSVLLLTLVGCSKEKENKNNLDLNATITDLDLEYGEMNEMSVDELLLVYDVDTSLAEEFVVKSSPLSNGNFYAIFKVNKDNQKTIKNQMNNLFKILEASSNLYAPEAVSLIKNRLETTIGDYLIYLISSDNNKLFEIVKAHIN